MIPQFSHEVQSSFILWFDHHLLDKGQAFSNKTGKLYYSADSQIPTYRSFSSPYKQWVADSSVSGATVPSGVWVGSNFSGRSNNLFLDYDNGRVLASGLSTSAQPTGAFSHKEFNVYATSDSVEDLIVEKKYLPAPKVGTNIPLSGIPPYQPVVPAIFIAAQNVDNSPFAFGGMDTTEVKLTATIFCESNYQLDGVLGLFADTKNKAIAHIPFQDAPYNEFGDLKTGYYNYDSLSNQYLASGLPLFIEKVSTAKITDQLRKSVQNEMFIGLLNFTVSQQRYPRL